LLYIYGQGDDDALARLLATHPPTAERIDRMVDRADRAATRTPAR
jgi:Zn-dependent protease with chaperone function